MVNTDEMRQTDQSSIAGGYGDDEVGVKASLKSQDGFWGQTIIQLCVVAPFASRTYGFGCNGRRTQDPEGKVDSSGKRALEHVDIL
jgi:hypothetical protein